jgi:hypothetical protein
LVAGGVAGTSYSARFHGTAAVNNSTGSLSAFVDMSGVLEKKELTFYYFNYYGVDSLFVELSTDGGMSFQKLKSLGANGYRWDLHKIEFQANSPTSVIRFRALTGNGNHSDIGIDEVNLKAVACYSPSGLGADPLLDGVNLNFVPSTTSTPSGFEYAVSLSSAAPTNGTYTTNTNAQVMGLTPATTYYAFVRSVCTGFGASPWISVSFKTATANCTPVYDRPCSWDPSFALIRRFRIKGENSTVIDKQASTCAGEYFNYTGASSITFARSKTYSGKITVDTFTNASIWIDFNDDNTFTSGEKIWNYLSLTNGENEFGFHIPSSSTTGIHKMRLRLNSAHPCNSTFLGQAHDYTVTIIDSALGSGYNISAGTPNNCVAGGGISINPVYNNHNSWVPFVDSSNNVIAAINANGNTLNFVSVYQYINAGPIRVDNNSKPYLDRNLQLSVQTQPITNVNIRLYLLASEFNTLKTADPTITSLNDLWLTKTSQACGNVMGSGQYLQPVNSGVTGNGYFVEYSIPGFSSFFFQGSLVILPVKLLPLTIRKTNGNNSLSWKTAIEQNGTGFELQVSDDGINFRTLAIVPTKAVNGNSNVELSYSYIDKNIYPARVYYMLHAIDKSGNRIPGNIAYIDPIRITGLHVVNVFPNPAKNEVTVRLHTSLNSEFNMEIINIAGKTLQQFGSYLKAGEHKIKLDISAIPAGSYIIKFIGNGVDKPVFTKLVKQ